MDEISFPVAGSGIMNTGRIISSKKILYIKEQTKKEII